MKRNWIKAAVIVAFVLVAFIVRTVLIKQEEALTAQETTGEMSTREVNYAEAVADDNPLLKSFCEQFPDASVVLACEEDVTDDGLKDLVVIYKQDDLTRTVVVTNGGETGEHQYSEPISAPIENQKIQFKNIDKEGPIEIVITGEKKGAVGYAIYRMIDGQPVDLFGEGMEDCC